MSVGVDVVLDQPEIPGNAGNIIRLAAITGCRLHIAGPTLFDFSDSRLKRAGLDYHDLAVLTQHADLAAAYTAINPQRVFAFTGDAHTWHTSIRYQPGDMLLFGKESTGLSAEAKNDPRVTAALRIPMLADRRSLNLANSVSIAVYEAWRQQGFPDAL